MIDIIPAVDIIDGNCVRLTRGDYGMKKVYDARPLDMALRYADCGVKRIHLVDLDGARLSLPVNLKTLETIAVKVDCELEWGGGISSSTALRDAFNAGATHAIVGSVAALEPQLFKTWIKAYADKVILGADIKDGLVAVKGWQEGTTLRIEDLLETFLPSSLKEVICTDIGRDGMLQGPSTELYAHLQSSFPDLGFTVSGGISSMDDIRVLDKLGLKKVIVGKAIYEGRITLENIEQWSLNA